MLFDTIFSPLVYLAPVLIGLFLKVLLCLGLLLEYFWKLTEHKTEVKEQVGFPLIGVLLYYQEVYRI